jgi:aminoglycoside 6'-N-acetyltransferase I
VAPTTNTALRVRPVTKDDSAAWLRLRQALWPEDGESSHPHEVALFLAGGSKNPLAVLVAEDRGEIVGFAELSIRAYAEGCSTDRVGFLEGWFVLPHARRRGVGRALVKGAEDWARAQGCTEFASDMLVTNEVSAAAHRALGFEEVEIIRCFRKNLDPHDEETR